MGVYIPNMKKPKNAFDCSKKINPEERMCIYTGEVFEETLSLLLDRPCRMGQRASWSKTANRNKCKRKNPESCSGGAC